MMDGVRGGVHIQDLIAARLSRRGLLSGMAGLPLLTLAPACASGAPAPEASANLAFTPVAATTADRVTVPIGYSARALIAWGDPLFESVAERFDPNTLTRAEQEQRFGCNNDMLALFPAAYSFPPRAEGRHLLCANHEYFSAEFFFPAAMQPDAFTRAQVEAMFASMGVSVVELEEGQGGRWRVLRDARPGAGRNRRITPFTPVLFDGPAATHRWIAAAKRDFPGGARADGAVACGTLANCGGGQTPWGTYLTAEENFQSYFAASNAGARALSNARADAAWRVAGESFSNAPWSTQTSPLAPLAPAQFDVSRSPYGPALYGWIVEIDPYDPSWIPRKRTALGRAKHECAATALTGDGRVAVYSGDDQPNEFVYKFVSEGRFDPADRAANRDLLSAGQLYAARFHADGTGEWLMLTPEAANAAAAADTAPFADAGDVVIRAREAARLMGATPMDRPEDVECVLDEAWVGVGPVLVVCTNNYAPHEERPGSPRREGAPGPQANVAGHILRIDEEGGDCGALKFRWDVFALAGDPAASAAPIPLPSGRMAQASVSHKGAPSFTGDRFACPDNICIDAARNVWIATDGSDAVFGDCNDSVLVTAATSASRVVKRFLVGPVGSEICGPTMAPDQKTFLVAVQHPGETDGAGRYFAAERWRTPGARPGSTFPDGGWPRAAIICVRKDDGGVIGS